MASTEHPTDCPGVPQAVDDDLLSSQRRCRMVTALAAAGDAVVVEDLATAVLAAEKKADAGALDSDDCRSAAEDIFEHHLPKLTAIGLVEYDSMLGTVRLTEPALARLAQRRLAQS